MARQSAAKKEQVVETEEMVLFWSGWPSQWHPSPFTVDGGIGLAADDPRSRDESQWQGANWLGNALERVRTTLRA